MKQSNDLPERKPSWIASALRVARHVPYSVRIGYVFSIGDDLVLGGDQYNQRPRSPTRNWQDTGVHKKQMTYYGRLKEIGYLLA